MTHLVAVGACYLDTILSVPYYPTEDEKLRASSIIHRRGGNCPNTLEVLQQLIERNSSASISLLLSTILPSSSSAGVRQIKSSLGPLIDLTHCFYREDFTEPATSYIIRSLSTDSRTIVNYNSLPEMTNEEFSAMADAISDIACWYHFEGRIPDVTIECVRYLRRSFPDVKISVEVEKPNRSGLQELATEADFVFYSKSWAQSTGHDSPEGFLRAQASLTPRASLLCCTWGESGASALELKDMTYVQSPAYVAKNAHVVDTIGAGDTFIAGMLYCLTCHYDDWTLEHHLRFANELAGRKVCQEGFLGLGDLMQHYA